MTLIKKALDLHQRGSLDEAEKIYLEILNITEDLESKSDILQLLGAVNLQKQNYNQSKEYLISSLKINPKNPYALNNLGILEKKNNNKEKAKFFFKKNIKYNHFLDSYTNAIEICTQNSELEEARQICVEALNKFPEDSGVKTAYAFLLFEQGNIEESLVLFEKITNSISSNPRSFYNYAIALMKIGNYKKSLLNINKFFLYSRNNADSFFLRHYIFKKLRNFIDAEKDLLSALKINGSNFKIQNALISFYLDFEKYLKVKSFCSIFLQDEKNSENINFFKSAIFLADLYLANWKSTYNEFSRSNKISIKSKEVLKPLHLCYTIDDPQQILDFSKYYWDQYLKDVNIKYKVYNNKNNNKNNNEKYKKIKIGFFSGDYREHAVSHLIKDLFSNFDKSKFEIYGYSFFKQSDYLRDEIKASFDKFFDLDYLSNQEMLDIVFKCNLDVAIDLSCYTKHNKSWIFAYQIAKIKINYLGYPGTMGSNDYDYLIADKHIIPSGLKKFYTEKIVYLPETYQPFSLKNIGNEKLQREDFDLPNNTFLIVSFSRIEKILPNIFEIWMKIIEKFKNVKLVLNISDKEVINNIKEFCNFMNFNFDKIIFVNKLPHLEHLKRLSLFDLYLDTYPYNSHTVLSDALFQSSLPAVSLVGNSFQSRVGSSLLHYADLKECITYNAKDYQNKILELIKNKDHLNNLKLKLEKRKKNLSNRMLKFTRDFEDVILDVLNI